MPAFCTPIHHAYRTKRWEAATCEIRSRQMFSKRNVLNRVYKFDGVAMPQKDPAEPTMSLKGLSYAAAAVILASIPNVNMPLSVPHLPEAAIAGGLNSSPLRFSQSLMLEDGFPVKLEAHWDVHSVESQTETFLLFSNDSGEVVDLWWIDYYGREVYYASIRPGTTHMQPSYATHPWVVRDHISQNSLLVMIANPQPSLAIVNSV